MPCNLDSGRAPKKLRELTLLWARGQLTTTQDDDDQADDELAESAAALGLAPPPRPGGTTRSVALWADNVAGWCAWLMVQTQWRVVVDGRGAQVRTGLDYAGVVALLQAQAAADDTPGAPRVAELLDDVRACEAAYLQEQRRALERRR